MPRYLQRLACAGARIVHSCGVRMARPAPVPATFRQENAHPEPATPSLPMPESTASSRAAGASRRASPVGRLRPVPADAGEVPKQAASPPAFQTTDPAKRIEATHLQVEAATPGPGSLQHAHEAKPEPFTGPKRTAIDSSQGGQQQPSASEPTLFSVAVWRDATSYQPPTSGPTSSHDADREPFQALPRMAVLTPSESTLDRAADMPERRLQRPPRIEVEPLVPARQPRTGATPQGSRKVPATESALPPHPKLERTVTEVSDRGTDRSSPLDGPPVSTPPIRASLPFQRAEPELHPPVPAPAAPGSGLTIQHLEVQIVERPRKELSQPSPAPIAPAGSAWDWPDRRHHGRVF